METALSLELIRRLVKAGRVVSRGGVAVIAHGLGRNAHDLDLWLDPLESSTQWAQHVLQNLASFSDLQLLAIGTWEPIEGHDLSETIDATGVCRVKGFERPVDLFRKPNELDIEDFEEVWNRGTSLEDGTRLPDVIDLLVTKQLTNRAKDQQDILFLEAKAQEIYVRELPLASAQTAKEMLDRYLTPEVARVATEHAEPSVREMGLRYLQELADADDPFAAEILRNWNC